MRMPDRIKESSSQIKQGICAFTITLVVIGGLLLGVWIVLTYVPTYGATYSYYNEAIEPSGETTASAPSIRVSHIPEPTSTSTSSPPPSPSPSSSPGRYTARAYLQDLSEAVEQAEQEIADGTYVGDLETRVDEIMAENELAVAFKAEQQATTIPSPSPSPSPSLSPSPLPTSANRYEGLTEIELLMEAKRQLKAEHGESYIPSNAELENRLAQLLAEQAGVDSSTVYTQDTPYCGIWINVSNSWFDDHKGGNEWSFQHFVSLDGESYEPVPAGGIWLNTNGSVTLYVKTIIREDDKYPDISENISEIELDTDQEIVVSGATWELTQHTEVYENNGAYAGHSCLIDTAWSIEFLYN